MIKNCEFCGQPFEQMNPMQKFCKRDHFIECPICGTSFQVNNSQLGSKEMRRTCSKKCSAELRKRTNIEKYGGVAPAASAEVRAKMEATTIERFGVAHAAQSDAVKEKTKATNQERYGVDSYLQTDEAKASYSAHFLDDAWREARAAKIRKTNLERYGAECVLGNADVREQIKQKMKEATGYEYALQNPETQKKVEETNLEKYGVRRPLQSDDIQSKMKETNKERYGAENPMQNSAIVDKVKQTCEERYGSSCVLHSAYGEAKIRETMRQKYGVDFFAESAEWKSKVMNDPSKINNLMEFRSDPEGYMKTHYSNTQISLSNLASELGIDSATVGQVVIAYNLSNYIAHVRSYMEKAIQSFLDTYDVEYIIDDRQAIKPLELDFYLPEYRLGIECDPTATHNSSVADPWGSGAKLSSYHKKKTDMCEAAGITLFHIFGYDWSHHPDIILSMLRNMIGRSNFKVYARKCTVREVSAEEALAFLNANHRQGAAQSPIRLGLYCNKELISLMTFGKMRNTIGTGKEDLTDCWELVRFCSRLNTSVIGGASKLFSHFIELYHPKQVRSFSDRAHTTGKLYKKLGFSELRRSEANYVWVEVATDKAHHRVNAQKKNLKKFLKDENIDLSKSEKQIMEEHGFVQVYDSGTITWEWRA